MLTVAGTNFVSNSGATNDIDVSLLTIAGEGGSYSLTSSDVEIASSTAFSVTLNAADQLVVLGLLNKNGTSSAGATTYNIAAAEDWMAGSATSVNVADLSGNGMGLRSKRYSMLVEDGVVKQLNIETKPGTVEESGGEKLLSQL